MNTLPRVRPGLLRHRLDDQALVYDARADKVHLLDPTTACVLELLEEGKWTADRITEEVARRVNVAPSDALLALSLDELRKADLLDSSTTPLPPVTDLRRREMLRKIGLAGAAALLIPAITTLTAKPAGAQGTCTRVGGGCAGTPPGNVPSADPTCCNGTCTSNFTCN